MYLSPGEAQERLIRSGIFTPDSVPDQDKLTFLLEEIQSYMDRWLDRSLEIQEYTQEVITNYAGIFAVRMFPVTCVKMVSRNNEQFGYGLDPKTPDTRRNHYVWKGGSQIWTGVAGERYQVVYEAGYSPIPSLVITQMFQLLKLVLKGRDLLDPTKDLQSVNVAGGMGQTFRLGDDKTPNWLERYMQPLQDYKNKIKT